MKTCLSLLTCDRPGLVEQSIKPLLEGARQNLYHLFVVDGSTSEANEDKIWHLAYPTGHMIANVRGGAGAAIVYALTMMLNHEENYDYVGLVESDVFLGDGWLDCLGLFERGREEGLAVGAVSARAYEDRTLFQRDGYAVMHNLGAGMIVFTREAARLVLDNFRTAWSTDNRRIFAQLSGVDIGSYWAFRMNEHNLTADFHWEPVLASHGLAALALTPSPVEMIGQNPPLAEQGLTIVRPGYARVIVAGDSSFDRYQTNLHNIRLGDGHLQLSVETKFHFDPTTGTWTYYPHQMHMLGGYYDGDWRLIEARGWGTFVWEARSERSFTETVLGSEPATLVDTTQLRVPIFGACAVLVSGGKSGGKMRVEDEHSGFKAEPELLPEEGNGVLQMMIPGGVVYRNLRITALTPGTRFYGIQSREKQPFLPNAGFDHSVLPTP